MSISDSTMGKIKEGKINYVTDKDGAGSSVLTQVVMENKMGVNLNPVLSNKNSEYIKNSPRLAIGLNDSLNGKEYGRVHVSSSKNETLVEKISDILEASVSREWISISAALEGKEKLDIKTDGVSVLDAYSRCDTREEKLEVLRSAYKIEGFNPKTDGVDLKVLPKELQDKISNSDKTFYKDAVSKELEHSKKIDIGNGRSVDIIVSKNEKIGKAINEQSKNNVIINSEKKTITINTDGKNIKSSDIMSSLGARFGYSINGNVYVKGSQIVIDAKSLKNVGLDRKQIIDAFKSSEKGQYGTLGNTVKSFLEERYGSMTSWSTTITDLYLKTVNSMNIQGFESNPTQLISVKGIGEVVGKIDDTGKVEIKFEKLTDEFIVANRSYNTFDYKGVKVITTFDEKEIPSSIKEIINNLPAEVREKFSQVVLVRPDEEYNTKIQEKISDLKDAMDSGSVQDKGVFVNIGSPESIIGTVFNEMKTIINDFVPTEEIFNHSGEAKDEVVTAINDFKEGLGDSFCNYLTDKLSGNENNDIKIGLSDTMKDFIDNTLSFKMNDIFILTSNMDLPTSEFERINEISERIEESKEIDYDEVANSFEDLSNFVDLFDVEFRALNTEIEILKYKYENEV